MKINRKQIRRIIKEMNIPNPRYIDDPEELQLQIAMKIKDMMPPKEAIMMNPADFKALAVSVYEEHFDPDREGWEPYPDDLEAIEDHLTIVPGPGDPDYEPPMNEGTNMKISYKQLRRRIRKELINEAPTLTRTGMSKGGKGPMVGLPKKSRETLQKELRTQLDSLRASGKTDNIPPEWLENLEKAKSHDMDPKFNLYMDEERGGPTDEELMALQKELNPTLFGKFKKMFGFKESVEPVRITKNQLRYLIREAMPKGGAPDVMGAMGGGKFQPRNYDVLDYEDWVKEEGHVTAASSSVMATYFLSQGIESQGLMKKLADHFKIDFHDVMRDYDRQEAEGNVVRGEGVVRVTESKLRKIIAQRILKKEK